MLEMPRLIQRTTSRIGAPTSEFAIPHYALWEDGSEYEVYWGHVDRLSRQAFRRYTGPLFGVPRGVWRVEELGA